jgi:hypothetical protein
MSSFKVTITLQSDLSSHELAEFFGALAKSEQGDLQPLMRILHPIDPPPLPPVVVEEAAPILATVVPQGEPAPAPAPAQKNTQWQRTSITLLDDATVDARIQAIVTGEFLSPTSTVSWFGIKHNPRSQHNQRILAALRAAPNRTMSFTSVGAQTGIPEREKLTGYLREMEKQGLITAARIPSAF